MNVRNWIVSFPAVCCPFRPDDIALGEGTAQISDVIKTQDAEKLHVSIRGLARKYQAFLPASSYLSREVALAVHSTNVDNYKCRFHQKFRSQKKHDGAGRYVVEGVGFKPDLSAETRKAEHMNCGCPIEDVLLEFFFWKMWTARSTNPAWKMIEEGMRGIIVSPRHRAFICQAFRFYTRLTLDDIYKWPSSGKSLKTYTALVLAYRVVEELQKTGMNIDLQVTFADHGHGQGQDAMQGQEGGADHEAAAGRGIGQNLTTEVVWR